MAPETSVLVMLFLLVGGAIVVTAVLFRWVYNRHRHDQPRAPRPAAPPEGVALLLLVAGGGSLLLAVLQLGAATQGTNLGGFLLQDALLNAVFGLLSLLCALLLRRRNRVAVLVFVANIILSIAWGFALGRGFNLVLAIVGLFGMAALIPMWRQGVLK